MQQPRPGNGLILVDLDGTLAYYDRFRGHNHIGKPVPAMVKRVQAWLHKGYEVRIFTARAALRSQAINNLIEAWCEEHIGRRLTVTCIKDPKCIAIYDDKAFRVIQNTGKVVTNQAMKRDN